MPWASDVLQAKTTKLMIAAILGALAAYAAGEMTVMQTVIAVVVALAKIFDRDTIARTQEKTVAAITRQTAVLGAEISTNGESLRSYVAPSLDRATKTAERLVGVSEQVLAKAVDLDVKPAEKQAPKKKL